MQEQLATEMTGESEDWELGCYAYMMMMSSMHVCKVLLRVWERSTRRGNERGQQHRSQRYR
jgi:hypothetical protein